MSEFKTETVSIAGAPTITFEVRGGTMRAELAGAKLYAEATSEDSADMRITDPTGFVMADLRVNPRGDLNLTENVTGVGSALLWSYWRWLLVQPIDTLTDEQRIAIERHARTSMRELIAKSSIGAGLADIKERGIDAHLADVEKGKF